LLVVNGKTYHKYVIIILMYGVNNTYRIKLYRTLNKIKRIQTTEIGRILYNSVISLLLILLMA